MFAVVLCLCWGSSFEVAGESVVGEALNCVYEPCKREKYLNNVIS